MCPARWKTRWGRGQTLQHPVPVAGGSLEQTGLPWYAASSPSRPLFPCCDRGFSWGLQAGGFLPSPPAGLLGQLEETGVGEPALHSNNNRLPAHWRPCWGPGLEPKRPPHSTPPLAKHVFLFSKGEQEARTHPESTRELISTDRPGCQGASWGGGDRSRARARPTWETILAKGPGSESEGEQQGPGCSRDKAPNLKSAFTEKRRPQGLPGSSTITDLRHTAHSALTLGVQVPIHLAASQPASMPGLLPASPFSVLGEHEK